MGGAQQKLGEELAGAGHAIRDGFNTVKDGVSDGIDITKHAVADGLETVGNGLKTAGDLTHEAIDGMTASMIENGSLGIAQVPEKPTEHPVAHKVGEMVGDGVSTFLGVAETTGSAAMGGASLALDSTGVLAPAGIAMSALTAAGAAHGSGMAVKSAGNLGDHAKDLVQMSKGEGTDEAKKFTKEELSTKPKNSPDPDKWQKKGGKITIDEDGTWTYYHPDGHSVRYNDGYPDFKSAGFIKQEVDIGEFQDYNADFKKADELAPNGPRGAESNTWHHHQDEKNAGNKQRNP